MKRREFITLLGGAAAWPLAARAQQTGKLPTIGWLDVIDPNSGPSEVLAGFKQGLAEQGYVVGRNVNLEVRSAGADANRLRVLAADFVRRQVAVIVSSAGTATQAVKAATQSIPIVFIMGGDPVEEGLVTSLNRPGGNLTGITFLATEIAAKRLELLHELVPKAESIAALVQLEGPNASDFSRAQSKGYQSAALALGVRLLLVNAATESDITGALANAIQQRAGALLIGADRTFSSANAQIISLANHYSLPTMFFRSGAVVAGALASYGDDVLYRNRQVGLYTGRILKGEKPADLPVLQPTKFELAINLKTAKAIGLNVSQDMLSIADEVIE
jgi:putative ABC transport system substrate-binding protein